MTPHTRHTAYTCTYMVQTYSIYKQKVSIQYSNYSVVSFPHYSSSIVVLTVITVCLVN